MVGKSLFYYTHQKTTLKSMEQASKHTLVAGVAFFSSLVYSVVYTVQFLLVLFFSRFVLLVWLGRKMFNLTTVYDLTLHDHIEDIDRF